MIRVGDKVRDKVTGFEGIVTARTEWLNKCVRVLVLSQKLTKEHALVEHQFDEEQVDLVTAQAVSLGKEIQTGGDRDFTPSRR